MANTDKLQIKFDTKSTDPSYGSKSQTARAVGVMSGTTISSTTSEAGIGALMPWANDLWFSNYTAQNGEGVGIGLWRLRRGSSTPELVSEDNTTDPARVVYNNRLWMGRHVIDTSGNVSNITGFGGTDRVSQYSGTPSTLYALTMGGLIYSVNITTLVATLVTDAGAGLSIVCFKHDKAMWAHPDGDHLFVGFNIENPTQRYDRAVIPQPFHLVRDPSHNDAMPIRPIEPGDWTPPGTMIGIGSDVGTRSYVPDDPRATPVVFENRWMMSVDPGSPLYAGPPAAPPASRPVNSGVDLSVAMVLLL